MVRHGKNGHAHGHTRGPRSVPANLRTSPTWKSWWSMISRCKYSTMGSSDRYLHMGITVCERWQTFENFLADMGERPLGTTLDRHPNRDGNYEPGNCRWATAGEQAQNRNTTKLTAETAAEVLRRFKQGESRRAIAAAMQLKYQTVWDLCAGRSWPALPR